MIRVLVVDDEVAPRELLRTSLQGSGRCQIVGEGFDGHDAIRLARELQPDVVILDVDMPRLNGLAALADVRRVAAHTRVLVYSSHGLAQREEALQRGAHAYRSKGDPLKQLVEAVIAIASRDT